jgi:hypothetical protein
MSQIVIIAAVIIGLVIAMRLIQPKTTPAEKYLLHVIQFKSPQIDNIRLYMFVKIVIHPVFTQNDLAYQDRYLNDPQQFKQLSEQLHNFGPAALFPLLGFEAVNWQMDVRAENPLFLRLTALQVLRRYPHTAQAVEDLLIHAPDEVSSRYFEKNNKNFKSTEQYRLRYAYNLSNVLKIISETARNDWWPGTSMDIREWAVSVLARLNKSFPEVTNTKSPSTFPQ